MTGHQPFVKAVGIALAGVLVLAACETERATVFEPTGGDIFDFSLGPNSAATLPSGTAVVGATSVTLTLASLPALSGASYQFWVVGKDAQNLDAPTAAFGPVLEFFLRDSVDAAGVVNDPLTGEPILVTDTNEVSLTRTSSYSGTDDVAVFAIEVIIDSTADGSNPGGPSNTAVVVSLEASAGATSPGPAQFLWRNTSAAGSGALNFGNFGGVSISDVSAGDYIYPIAGGGQGGIRGSEISAGVEELSRPPVGFFYRGYLVDDAGNAVMVDTLRSEWSADSTRSRVSLYNADDNGLLPGLSGMNITQAQIRNCVSGSGVLNCANSLSLSPSNANLPFGDFLTFALALEPKGAAGEIGGAVVITGEVPDEARN